VASGPGVAGVASRAGARASLAVHAVMASKQPAPSADQTPEGTA
jgi:hypothetical protein